MSVALRLPVLDQDAGEFDCRITAATGAELTACAIDTIQVNIGLTCDLACRHCHVESSPKRTEQMDWPTMLLVLRAANSAGASTIDITGGAPEMNPHFRDFVTAVRRDELAAIVRTNLTIMLCDEHEDLPFFYAATGAHLIASLPCYLPENVDKQRGGHVYERSVEVIQRLNAVGYGVDESLPLDLVYNPLGPSLPPDQADLERDYRRELDERFGIRFTRLITITNMPIGRYLRDLHHQGVAEDYRRLLVDSFNGQTVEDLMCRRQVHVSWDGTLHDCDFNYALGVTTSATGPRHVRDFDAATLAKRRIATGDHCFGCCAGHGSSCGGSLV